MKILAAICRSGRGDYIVFDYQPKDKVMSTDTGPMLATCKTDEDKAITHQMTALRIPWSVLSRGLSAGFTWSEMLDLLIEYGLPLLKSWIDEILDGRKTKAETMAKPLASKAMLSPPH